MQSLHYNSGSIKLTRERATMVARWEPNEVASWIAGLAGIQSEISDLFLQHHVNGAALSTLLREDLIQMGIAKLDQQLIIMQSIDLLLTLVNRLSNETLALLFMRIHCTATTCYNILKKNDEAINDNSNVTNSPEFYTSISNLSNAIVETCHWLGRLPFIEIVEYIELRRKIIKALVQIRLLVRNLRLIDQINMPKSKLILEINELRTTAISLVRQNKDSLFSSDCYLTRVNLRRPIKDDVNIEYTTMPDYTHVISSIETEAISSMGSGFTAINIGDEIIEINNQVVIGWDPKHFPELLRSSSRPKEICLLVKKMPRHNEDEIYPKRYADLTPNPRRTRGRAAQDRMKQAEDTRIRLLEQEGEIDVESDDETLYQSKRSSQIKRDQHSSLPDLTESITETSHSTNDISQISDQIEPSSSNSSVSIVSPTSPITINSKQNKNVSSSPSQTPKSQKKSHIESYLRTFLRPRQNSKSIIPDTNEQNVKDEPQLVGLTRINSNYKQNSPSPSLNDEQIISNSSSPTLDRHADDRHTSLTNIFPESEQQRIKRQQNVDSRKAMTYRNEPKIQNGPIVGHNNYGIVANKPPLNHRENRKNSGTTERRPPKRKPSYRKISCKDLGKGDCEGFLHRYLRKGTLSLPQWRTYWCVLKGGTLYIFKSKDEKNQEIEIKLEGKNVSPAPDRKKHAFRVADESSKYPEYFYCSTRDEMAKWMNKMGLAAINFNMDDSKIGGFNKGFVDSREGSPASTSSLFSNDKQQRTGHIGSIGDSENESDKDSVVSWHKLSVSDTEQPRDKKADLSFFARHARSSSSASILSDAHNSPINSPSNRFVGEINRIHYRANSSPVRSRIYNDDEHENAYVSAAPRLSDSDSSSEVPYQRMFITNSINVNQPEMRMSNNQQQRMFTSSGGFTTPPITTIPPQRIFMPTDDELSSPSTRSLDIPTNLSSTSSSQPCSPAVVRTAPVYVSVYTSTPPVPLVKGTIATSTPAPPSTNDDESFFTRRSPSPSRKPPPPPVAKKPDPATIYKFTTNQTHK